MVGSTLPEFAAQDSNGNRVTAAQLRGQPRVLLFLSSGCAPCVDLASELSGADLGEIASSLIVKLINLATAIRPPMTHQAVPAGGRP